MGNSNWPEAFQCILIIVGIFEAESYESQSSTRLVLCNKYDEPLPMGIHAQIQNGDQLREINST